MKYKNIAHVCFAIAGVLGSLQCGESGVTDPQVVQQQTEDAQAFVALMELWTDVSNKYFQKIDNNTTIKCKTCSDEVSIGTFEGYMMAWAIKGIGEGHATFEKIRILLEQYIKLLFEDASADVLKDFMVNTSNDMKQVCFECQNAVWIK